MHKKLVKEGIFDDRGVRQRKETDFHTFVTFTFCTQYDEFIFECKFLKRKVT